MTTRPFDLPSVTRRTFLDRVGKAATAAMGIALTGPAPLLRASPRPTPPVPAFDADVATEWFDMCLHLVRSTPGFSPPVASRAFAYAGVTLYEALLPGVHGARSLAGQINELAPTPGSSDPARHWPTVANAALASILRRLFPTATPRDAAALDALEASFAERFRAGVPVGIYRRSVARGRSVADHVFEWSRSDGGHEGYLNNFPPYVPPAGSGLWVPTPPAFLPALQPSWGSNRPFALTSGRRCAPGGPPPYSEDPSSAFHAEADECYDVVTNLSPTQEEIALFWSDDPGLTSTPPGHSISILTQVMRSQRSTLDVAAEAYAKLGIAVADAFIACWNTKYRYNLLRPVTYIRRVIDPGWTPLLATPPFPEYTSGHSVQSAAAAEVLGDLFGRVPFTDHTHDARGLAPRSFGSFVEAAREAAISRLYGGIHFRTAIEHGLEQGRCVGRKVNALRMRGTG